MPQLPISIRIPAIPATPTKIGENFVRQISNRARTIQCQTYTVEGNVLRLTDQLGQTYSLSLDGGLRQFTNQENVLRSANGLIDIEALNERTPLVWKQLRNIVEPTSPAEVITDWGDKFRFQEEDLTLQGEGLREPQIGAIHAVAAHLAVDTSPVTVVMPTGTGKTETMISIVVYRRVPKVLVLVPTDPLRTQLADKFVTLGYLPEIGVLPSDVSLPRVCMIKKGVRNAADAESLAAESNVLVATPDILNACNPAALESICSSCDMLFVDEAHHIAAKTWKTVKDQFVRVSKPVVQFTATPFRNDGGNLEGKIIFNYPLRRAQNNGYFKPIRFFPVTEYLKSDGDRAIATKAIEILLSDIAAGLDHVMMARVQDTNRAAAVAAIYRSIQNQWEPLVIHSRMNKRERDVALEKLLTGRSKICICVKMLGEGFDFPNLKVAAIHDVHKSLAVTLQFIGRFTRTSRASIGDAAFVANIAEPNVEGELQSLYSQSPDWDHIIKQQSEDQIEREIRHQELIEGFRDQGDLKRVISLWNLRPAFSTMIFRTPAGRVLNPSVVEGLLPKNSKVRSSHNPDKNLFVCVAERDEEVTWGRYKGVRNHNLELLVVRYLPQLQALFVHASDYDFFRVENLARLMVTGSTGVVGEPVFRVFSSVERPMVRNLGARKTGDISFTMHFGPNVLGVMTDVEMGSSELSNLAGWGYEDGERCTWGCSQKKGKVWSMGGGNMLDWSDWTDRAWNKVSDNALERNAIISSFLCAVPMTDGRPRSAPISIQWGDRTAAADEERVTIVLAGVEFHLSEIDLVIDDFEEEGPVLFSVVSETSAAKFRLEHSAASDGGANFSYSEVTDVGVTIKIGGRQPVSFIEHAISDPLLVTYANGDRSYNQFLIANPTAVGLFRREAIRTLDWTGDGVDIRTESQGQERNPRSIQNRIARECLNDYDIVFDDDNSGEAADLVCIRRDEATNSIEILLVHCKFSSEDTAGARVKDVYEVSGQAQKSISWKHNGFPKLVAHMKKREERWRALGSTRFMKGDMAALIFFKEVSRKSKLKMHMWIVQPGLSKAGASSGMLSVLGAAQEYLGQTSNAELTVFGSE